MVFSGGRVELTPALVVGWAGGMEFAEEGAEVAAR